MSVCELQELSQALDMDLGNLEDEADRALHQELEMAYDDVSGDQLQPEKVKQARSEEMAYFRDMGVYDVVPLSECFNATGRPPITTTWIDTNKGDTSAPNYRSRLVGREFKLNDRPDLFAATPRRRPSSFCFQDWRTRTGR